MLDLATQSDIFDCGPLDDELEDKKPLIVSGLKIVLQDSNLKVIA